VAVHTNTRRDFITMAAAASGVMALPTLAGAATRT
jgi:hypothetical protein